MNRSSLGAVLLLLLPALHAGSTANPSGHWEGAINAPGRDVTIEIDLAQNGKGELKGTFTNPADKLKGFPLGEVSVEDRSVWLVLKAGSGGGTFEGTLSTNGTSLSGNFITAEGGFSVPFNLTRTGEAKMELTPKSPAIGKEMEGVWDGTMSGNGRPMRLVLTITNHTDGTSSGTIAAADDGLEIPIATIVQKASSLTFEVKSEGGFYSGALNAGGTELTGTYTQDSAVLPLNFQRTPATEGKK